MDTDKKNTVLKTNFLGTVKTEKGFTITELLIVVAIIGLLSAVAIPSYNSWIPNYHLMGASRDLYSNMQKAKIGAIKTNKDWAIIFDTINNTYTICSDSGDGDWTTTADNIEEEIVILSDYKSGIRYGDGSNSVPSANKPTPIGASFDDFVTYSPPVNIATFTSRGTGNGGYVYLVHQENTATFAVGTLTSGVIRLRKWTGSAWE